LPRGPCHFSLLSSLHERLHRESPELAAAADMHLPEFLAGSVAPDALRYVSRMGKFGTHFYSEDREETWGRSVTGMFSAHPDLSNPQTLSEADRVLMMGYISHLAADEAFRDTVTYQLHGTDNWQPVVEGLWSLVDELPIGYDGLGDGLDRFVRRDSVGFIRCGDVRTFIELIRPWAKCVDPWQMEQVYYMLTSRTGSLEDAHAEWFANRERARHLLDSARLDAFVESAITAAFTHVSAFVNGEYTD